MSLPFLPTRSRFTVLPSAGSTDPTTMFPDRLVEMDPDFRGYLGIIGGRYGINHPLACSAYEVDPEVQDDAVAQALRIQPANLLGEQRKVCAILKHLGGFDLGQGNRSLLALPPDKDIVYLILGFIPGKVLFVERRRPDGKHPEIRLRGRTRNRWEGVGAKLALTFTV